MRNPPSTLAGGTSILERLEGVQVKLARLRIERRGGSVASEVVSRLRAASKFGAQELCLSAGASARSHCTMQRKPHVQVKPGDGGLVNLSSTPADIISDANAWRGGLVRLNGLHLS